MNLADFSNEFDILINEKYSTNTMIQVDEYEKSVFLTRAQDIVFYKYESLFDNNDIARTILQPVLREVEYPLVVNTSATKLTNNSYKVDIDNDNLWRIKQEHLLVGTNRISVVPERYDEWNRTKNSPFRKPSTRRVLRVSTSVANDLSFELLLPDGMTIGIDDRYFCRYLITPDPIILEDALFTVDSTELTIRNNNTTNPVWLHERSHPEILEIAVQLAASSTGRLADSKQEE